MIDFGKFPFEKAVHFVAKVLPGFALLFVYDAKNACAVTGILSLPYLGYATRVWLLIAVCFILGYTLSSVLNTVAGGASGAIGALWASIARTKHPYEYQVAPWRDTNWRAAYISRFGSCAPKDLTLILPADAAELLRLSQPLPPNVADQQKLAEQITLQINAGLKAAIEAIQNDTEWRMCYENIKLKVLFQQPLEPIEEVIGRIDSDLSVASAVLVVGAVVSTDLRVWWLMLPAMGWLIVGVIRFSAKAYQVVAPWSTLSAQIEMLRSRSV